MISIIVPVYNVEQYLPQCLDSLIGQTCRDLEIICVNDGSTDGSLAVLEQYARKDERIKVITCKNRGPSETRNEGMAQANGDWLMFVDSDDFLATDCCEFALRAGGNQDLVFFSYIREFRSMSAPKYILGHQTLTYDGDRKEWLCERLIAPTGDELRQPANLDSLSTVWGKLYRTSIIREHNISFVSTKKTGTLEDLLFNSQYFRHMQNAVYLPETLYHYRKAKADSIAYSFKPDLPKQWLYVYDQILRTANSDHSPWLAAALERRKALCLFGLGLNIVFSKKGWRQEHEMLGGIICSDWYQTAVAQLDTTPMPLHWRGFYGAARRRQTWAVLLMVKAINVVINR